MSVEWDKLAQKQQEHTPRNDWKFYNLTDEWATIVLDISKHPYEDWYDWNKEPKMSKEQRDSNDTRRYHWKNPANDTLLILKQNRMNVLVEAMTEVGMPTKEHKTMTFEAKIGINDKQRPILKIKGISYS